MALRNAGCAPSSNGCALSSSTEIYLANSGPVEDGLSQEMLSASRRAIKAGRGPQSDDRKAGRRPVLSDREVRQVVRAAATGDYFAADLKTKFSVTASVRTIQRLLKNVDHLVYTKMDRTLPLTAAHKSARMAWAQEHILNPGIWESTNFSDEKKFNLDGPEGYKFYSHDLRQPTQSYVRRQNGGGSVMVCGAFSDKGKSKLAILRDRQNSASQCFDSRFS
ncbi:hypothetical protein PC110_g4446 [Phytophthora cactorum]|uniref:Transposase Tc1-like domain-containing protein n=1 Tax=Phytophthora cactorum TaxID=29920 RepID=A0A329SQX2_9STRA|nr:hypothetical protein PC110_g4446 [Phytophthora cactorum]